jgi:hypothetical protein
MWLRMMWKPNCNKRADVGALWLEIDQETPARLKNDEHAD